MWGMRATTIPVVIGALGLIKKGLEKYTKQMKISELQKIALLGTSRILRKTLSIKWDRLLLHELGYCVVHGHKVIGDNNNCNNNNNNNNNNTKGLYCFF